jgi:hypothetical protein
VPQTLVGGALMGGEHPKSQLIRENLEGKKMKSRVLGLSLLGMLAMQPAVWADSSASAPAAESTSSSSSVLQTIRKNIRGTYVNEFSGPTIRSLSGNTDGGGTNLQMIHYMALSYKIGSKWSVGLTQPFYQRIDEKPSTEVDPFEASDPYFTVTNPKIWGSEKYGWNLYGYARYYIPVSRATRQTADAASPKDNGNGRVRLFLNPTKTFLDGAVSLNLQTLFQYRLASRNNADRTAANGNSKRDDLIFVFDPILAYTFNDTYDAYLEYSFDMSHSTSGHWTYWRKSDYISLGSDVNVTKKLLLNPYVLMDAALDQVKYTQIGITAVYYFL